MQITIRIASSVRPEDVESVVLQIINSLRETGADLANTEIVLEMEEPDPVKTLDPILLN